MTFRDKLIAYENQMEREDQEDIGRQEREAERFEQVCENLTAELHEAEMLLENAVDGHGLEVFADRLQQIAEMTERLSEEF